MKIKNEEKKIKQQQEWLDYENKVDTSIKLHVAGDVKKDFVYEPIGYGLYLVRTSRDKKYITKAKKIDNPENKYDKRNYIQVGNNYYEFEALPIREKLIFYVPDMDLINKYCKGEYTIKNATEIYNEIYKKLNILIDLHQDYYYHIATLSIMQSYLRNVLNVIWYLQIAGGFGGGKTALMDIITSMQYHGFLSGSTSASSIPRLIDRYKLSIGLDEIDSKQKHNDDNEELMILRQGYKKGKPFVRCAKNTLKPEAYDVFGSKSFTIHSNLEKALRTRSMPIYIGESYDQRLSILNIDIISLIKSEINSLWFWYMENAINFKHNGHGIKSVEIPETEDIETIRESIYSQLTEHLNQEEKDFLKKFKGRNAELGYIALSISKIANANVLSHIEEAFKMKVEEEFDSITDIESIVKSVLRDYYDNRDDTNEIYELVYETFKFSLDLQFESKKLKHISTQKLKGYLRDCGFIDKENMKKKKHDGKLLQTLFFDRRVLTKLGYDVNGDSNE